MKNVCKNNLKANWKEFINKNWGTDEEECAEARQVEWVVWSQFRTREASNICEWREQLGTYKTSHCNMKAVGDKTKQG